MLKLRSLYIRSPNLKRNLSKYTMGIRREDKDVWERRTPLSPTHVKQLVASGIDVFVQPSHIRCFPDEEYVKVCRIFPVITTHYFVFSWNLSIVIIILLL